MTAETRGLARPFDHHQRAALSALHLAQFRGERLEARRRAWPGKGARAELETRLALDLDRGRPSLARRGHGHQRADLDRGHRAEGVFEFIRAEVERLRRRIERRLALRGFGGGSGLLGDPDRLGQHAARLDDPDHGARGQVVEDRVERAPEQQRGQQLRAGEQQSVGQRVAQFRQLFTHQADFARAERYALAHLVILERDRRHQASANHDRVARLAQRALRGGIELAHGGHDVLFQLDSHRIVVERREDVDDSAAHAEIARLLGLRHPLIAGRAQRVDERFEIERVGGGDAHHRGLEHRPRQRAHQQRLGRGDEHRGFAAERRVQRRELRRLRMRRRREMCERLQLPGGQQMNPARARIALGRLVEKKSDLARQRLGLARERSYHQDRAAESERSLPQHQRSRRALKAHQRKAASAARVQACPKLARRLFQTPFQIDLRPLRLVPDGSPLMNCGIKDQTQWSNQR